MSTITWPADVVDPHVHQWDPLTTTRAGSGRARLLRRLPRIPRDLRVIAPRADREFVGDPHHVLKPYLPGDYRADAGEVPVGTLVHIEAEWPAAQHLDTVGETRWVLGLPWGRDGAPRLGALVVHADPRWDDVAAVLDAHLAAAEEAASPGGPAVRGVRCSAARHPDPAVRDFADGPAVLADPAFLRGFAAIAERGLSFELWCYAHQLPSALALVRAYPETPFVLCHHGTPVGVLGRRGRHTGRYAFQRDHQLRAWREDVAALAAHPNVVAKHSGLGMPVLGGEVRRPRGPQDLGPLTEAVAPLVRHVHDCFGAERTMWASNFPIDKPGLTLPATVQVLVDVLGADADLPALLGGVARRTYRLSPPEW